jgi:glycosyltransferase involved in cell wall biosynthesis|tara:strand:+ start:265 stop:1164 length:900 start_codon:yes stop_codon:yes gene_type:complete
MKITFIYANENEEWSTPLSLAYEFEDRGWDVGIVSIGSNSTQQYYDDNIKVWLDEKDDTDIVLFMDWGRFDSPLLDKEKLPSAFWIQESGDDPQNFDNNYPKSERFDMTLSPDSDSAEEYKKRGRNAYWWTHFADTAVQFPIEEIEETYVAVTSRGMGGSQFLDTLTLHGDGTIANMNGMDSEEHTEFLNSGMMVLQHSRWGEVTRRIFEGMACGKMVLCDRLDKSKKLDELFEEGEDIIYYDDMVDCINKMNKYSQNKKERERIAKNGYRKVLDNHTQIQRVDFIIEKFNEWKDSQSA